MREVHGDMHGMYVCVYAIYILYMNDRQGEKRNDRMNVQRQLDMRCYFPVSKVWNGKRRREGGAGDGGEEEVVVLLEEALALALA